MYKFDKISTLYLSAGTIPVEVSMGKCRVHSVEFKIVECGATTMINGIADGNTCLPRSATKQMISKGNNWDKHVPYVIQEMQRRNPNSRRRGQPFDLLDVPSVAEIAERPVLVVVDDTENGLGLFIAIPDKEDSDFEYVGSTDEISTSYVRKCFISPTMFRNMIHKDAIVCLYYRGARDLGHFQSLEVP